MFTSFLLIGSFSGQSSNLSHDISLEGSEETVQFRSYYVISLLQGFLMDPNEINEMLKLMLKLMKCCSRIGPGYIKDGDMQQLSPSEHNGMGPQKTCSKSLSNQILFLPTYFGNKKQL